MAYTETVYASDSWESVGGYDTTNVRRGTSLASIATFDFYNNGTTNGVAIVYSAVHLKFPQPQKYSKKRLISSSLYIYVVSTNTSAYGELNGGDYIFQIVDFSSTFFTRNQSYYYGSAYALSNLPRGRYLSLPWYKGYAISVKAGATSSFMKGESYTVEAGVTIQSHTASNKPYALLTFEDVVPYVKSPYPSSGFVNEKQPATFNWQLGYDNPNIASVYGNVKAVRGELKQSAAKFRWRPYGQTAYTEIAINGDQQYITIPANTFKTAQIQWQIILTSDDGIEGTPSEWFTLTTVDSLSAPIAVSPKDVMIDGAEIVRFYWDHVIETGSPQTKFELQYSEDNGLNWKALASGSTEQTYTDIPANTLPAGQLMWRVRTYNSDGVVGSWSEPIYVTVRSAPAIPSISDIGQNARPTIRWKSVGQQSYELIILNGGREVYRTDEIASTVNQHKVTDYLPNGSYTVTLRIKNIYGLASAWASAAFTVAYAAPAAPDIAVESLMGVAILSFAASGYAKLYILRDGIPIAKLPPTTTSWQDYSALGTHSYVLRGVDASDSFSDSVPAVCTVAVNHAVLAPADNLQDMIRLIYHRDSPPLLTGSLEPSGQAAFYAGRTRPVYEFAEFAAAPLTLTYSLLQRDDLDRLLELVQHCGPVRYRDHRGEARWCILTSIQYSIERGVYEVTLSATDTDYVERIDYDTEG